MPSEDLSASSDPLSSLPHIDPCWERALCAPSTSVAVSRALLLLPSNEFPTAAAARAEKLPKWVQRNIACIVRALSHLLAKEVIESLRLGDDFARGLVEKARLLDSVNVRPRKSRKRRREDLIVSEAKKVRAEKEEPKGLSDEERAYAGVLAAWATDERNYASKGPPADAVEALLKCGDPDSFVDLAFAGSMSDDAVGNLAGHLLEGSGYRVAVAVVKMLMARVGRLQRAAPRVLVGQVVRAGMMNGRAVVEGVFNGGLDVGDVVGEVMSKVVRECLTSDLVEVVLEKAARSKWGSGGVRAVEELVGKCSQDVGQGAWEGLLEGLDRSVGSKEKCLRFAKLLWVIVKKWPKQSRANSQALEKIIGCSKVFLAKRALETLKSSD